MRISDWSADVCSSDLSVRETMAKAQLSSQDVDRVVFVGGPTQYKTVRDKVAFELGLPGALDVNPMAAVAEGAAIFAESVDWGSQRKGRKATRGAVSAGSRSEEQPSELPSLMRTS